MSYAHENSETAARLAEELQARGFRTWQDIHDVRLGKRIESEMETGIAKSEAVLHVLTPAALFSPAVRREVELGLDRRRREDGFTILVAAQDLGESFEEVGRRTLQEFGENLARDLLELLPAGPAPVAVEAAAAYAKKVLRSFFARGEGSADDEAWRIGLHSRGSAGGGYHLELDWRALFGTERRAPGDFDSWSRAWRAVRDVRDVLADHSSRRRVTLTAAGHQTAAILFGLAFCCNGHWRLAVTGQDGEVWQRGAAETSHEPFAITRRPEAMDGTYLTVEVEVARKVLAAVSARIAEIGEEPRARILVCRPDGPSWVDAVAGAALARSLAAEVRSAVDELHVGRAEIFAAAPFPLCVLLAAELGSLHAELALFEFHDGRYEPALAIPEEER